MRLCMEYDQPPADDRRRGQTRVTWDTFWMLKMEQFEKIWLYDPQGRRVYTMLRLRDPIMHGIRLFGLLRRTRYRTREGLEGYDLI